MLSAHTGHIKGRHIITDVPEEPRKWQRLISPVPIRNPAQYPRYVINPEYESRKNIKRMPRDSRLE